jgi:hypothetical protein
MAPPILLRRQSGLFRILMTVVLCPVAVAIAALAFASTAAGQELSAMGNFCVAGIRDGRTLVLADGRELRLAGIEASDAGRAAGSACRWTNAAAGKTSGRK